MATEAGLIDPQVLISVASPLLGCSWDSGEDLITATLGFGLSVGLWVLWTLLAQGVGQDGQDQWIIFEHPSQESYFQWALKECQCAKKGMVSFICLKLGWAYQTPNEIMLQLPDNVPNLYLA